MRAMRPVTWMVTVCLAFGPTAGTVRTSAQDLTTSVAHGPVDHHTISLVDAATKAALEMPLTSERSTPLDDKNPGRVAPATGQSMLWSTLGLVAGVGGISVALYNVGVRKSGECKDMNPVYSRPCPGSFGIGLGLLNGAMGLWLTAAKWPRGSQVPRVVGRHADGTTTIEVRNRSEHDIMVLLQGPATHSRLVAAWSSEVMTVHPGRYQETVHTTTAAAPFRALQTYERGTAYLETYFIDK